MQDRRPEFYQRKYFKDKYFSTSLRLTGEQAGLLAGYASAHGLSVSEALRQCVVKVCKQETEVA